MLFFYSRAWPGRKTLHFCDNFLPEGNYFSAIEDLFQIFVSNFFDGIMPDLFVHIYLVCVCIFLTVCVCVFLTGLGRDAPREFGVFSPSLRERPGREHFAGL